MNHDGRMAIATAHLHVCMSVRMSKLRRLATIDGWNDGWRLYARMHVLPPCAEITWVQCSV